MTSRGPLAGIRVLEFGQVLAAPYAGMMLADQGAEVIKIEPPAGEPSRGYMPPDVDGHSPYFLSVNRNKLGFAVDLKSDAGRQAVLDLAARSDVVIENFRAGVMDRLGLGYETLKALNRGVVYCAVSGYGRSGAFADRAGYDPIAQAESGLMALTGEKDGPPMRSGTSLVDMATGMFAAQAITAALFARHGTGEGQVVEVSLYGSALNMLVNFAAQSLICGDDPRRFGSGSQAAQPSGVYRSKDGEFMITVGSDSMYRRFCEEVLGRPDLGTDPRFATNAGRLRNKDAMDQAFAPVFAGYANADLIRRMRAAAIPCGEILGVRDALASPMTEALGLIGSAPHAALGELKTLLPGYSFSRTPVRDPIGAPLIGEHSRDVLRRVAGYDEARIEALIAEGAVVAP
jgi:crotonobetainyl-CoA:carnitine CoA-transferase CaiB-like acyl-CoA transferase